MALEVLGREAAMLGEDGFMGNGGGARSGSELSHLKFTVSMPLAEIQWDRCTWEQLLARSLRRQSVDASVVSPHLGRSLDLWMAWLPM
jgi:hypothetical protein